MLVSDFHYDLPEDLIAQRPPTVRGSSRMMALDRRTGAFADHLFTELPVLLRSGDLLVLNDSRVLPARLFATRAGLTTQANSPAPSGQVEVLLTQRLASPHNDWAALIKPAKKVQPGEVLHFADPALTATVLSAADFGERTLRFSPVPDFHATLGRIGHLPLPPYIHRSKDEPNTPEDRERYQTVFSRERGSVAAPTAGLHFTPQILDALTARGVEIARLTLHVGLGTFAPLRVERVDEVRLHREHYTLTPSAANSINSAARSARRIVAVGTTVVRTLEHCALQAKGKPLQPHSGETEIFISPGFQFRLVGALLTNFHLPQSSLLMLVSAFAGREPVLAAYRHAVQQHYRFFSYGDCMFLE